MAFDPIVACLKQITDYPRYERFCTDLMRFDGYGGIEPLGGVADKGRDSILLRNGNEVIFHYSVRKDWKTKLWQGAEGVREHGHHCNTIVCVNPAEFTTPERDTCIAEFKQEFGWSLELYGVERIASMLRSTAAPLLTAYPQIFVPHLIEANRHAQVDVRINPTRDKRRQLAQIVAYNRGPGPILIEAWHACWTVDGRPIGRGSIECHCGSLPARLEEKDKLDIIVPLDFEWQELTELGLVDAERRRHDAPEDNVKSFVRVARLHMPPPRKPADEALTLEQIQAQPVSLLLRSERVLGGKQERLLLILRNDGDLPLMPVDASIEWKFDTDQALAARADTPGPKVVESGAIVFLRRISATDTSCKGNEVQFVLSDQMATMLVEVIMRQKDIVAVQAAVSIAPKFQISETENIREVVTSFAQSIIDSWD